TAERREAREHGIPPDVAEQGVAEDVGNVLSAMAVAAPLAIAAAALLGWWLARRALQPLVEASARVRAARSGELDLSLPVGSGREWDELATTLNALLADARSSMARNRHFTAEAAHELRTPLTTMIREA